jgi:dsRNA-specific ribonuclease
LLKKLIVSFYLFNRYSKQDEGFMTRLQTKLEDKKNLSIFSKEIGLNKHFIISRQIELMNGRNLEKINEDVFESFIGALFLDLNKITVKDEDKWFENVFITGPGFQMVQKFVENVFEKHIDWVALIQNDDNYKNILQVKIQKEFKVTPHYLEIEHDMELGYKMGVYLCLGQQIHTLSHTDAVDISYFQNFKAIQDFVAENGKAFIFMGEGQHKIKRKAEQIACNEALNFLEN